MYQYSNLCLQWYSIICTHGMLLIHLSIFSYFSCLHFLRSIFGSVIAGSYIIICWCIELINVFQTLAPFLTLSTVFVCVLMFTHAYYLSWIYVGGVVFWTGWLFPDGRVFCAVLLGECLFRSCPFVVRLLFIILIRCVFSKGIKTDLTLCFLLSLFLLLGLCPVLN